MNLRLLFLCCAISFSAAHANAQTASVQFIHNSADPSIETVDIWINDSLRVDNLVYHHATPMLLMDTVTNAVCQLRNASDSSIVYHSWSVNLAAGSKHIFTLFGQLSIELYAPARPLAVEQFSEALELSTSTSSIDVLFFQGATELDSADIAESQLFQLTAFEQLPYGSYSGYINLFTADYGWSILSTEGEQLFGEYALPVTALNWAGKAITIVTSGFINQSQNNLGHALGMWATTRDGGPMVCLQPLQWNVNAHVQFLHNASSDNIRIETDTVAWLTNLDEHTATPYTPFPAGKDVVLTIASGISGQSMDSLWSDTLHLYSGRNYQLIWHGGASPEHPLDLRIHETENTPNLNENQCLLRLFNGSSDFSSINLLADTTIQSPIFQNIGFGSMSDTLSLLTMQEEWILRSSNDSITAFDAPLDTLNLSQKNVTALTYSSTNNNLPSLWLSTEEGGPMHPLSTLVVPEFPVYCMLQLVHVSADTSLQSIDVYLNDTLAVEALEFEAASGLLSARCNQPIPIRITPHGDPLNAIHFDTLEVEPNQSHRLFLWGINNTSGYNPAPALEWALDADFAIESSLEGNTDVNFFHAATDLGAVEIHEITAPVIPLFSSLSSGEFSFAQGINAQANYQIELRNSATQFLYNTYLLPTFGSDWENEAVTLISTGFRQPANNSNGQTLQMWALTPDGAMTPLEENPASIEALNRNNILSVYPNPAKDLLHVHFTNQGLQNATIRIFDGTGHLVYERKHNPANGIMDETFSLAGLSDGNYTLWISDETQRLCHPFSIVR